jgi:steroid delta-isomerase-like uncharacterized protein
MSSAEVNKVTIRRYVEDALAEVPSGHLTATDDFLTSDAAFHDPGQAPSVGTGAHKQRSAILFGAFPNVRFAIENMVAEGERVAVRWTVRGTLQSGFMSLPPTGKEVRLSGITMYRLSGGRIAEGRSNFDQLGVLQSLGVIPSPGQAGR